MKDKRNPLKQKLVDQKPISVPMVTSSGSIARTAAPKRTGSSAPTTVSTSTMTSPPPNAAGGQQTVNSISRLEHGSRPGLISRGTQTGGDMPEDLQEKRRLIRKQLAVLLHAVLCRVRDELIGNVGESARQCPTAYCGLMKNVLTHLLTCENQTNCTYPHCLSSRQILSHWKACTQNDCPVCSSLRRVVPAYLDAVVSNPRWRDEIMNRFHWLITFIGPINLRIPPPTRPEARLTEEEEREKNAVKNCEE